jgi:hypothetical protein
MYLQALKEDEAWDDTSRFEDREDKIQQCEHQQPSQLAAKLLLNQNQSTLPQKAVT